MSRQTIYAIEAGSYVPNTAVSLQLARVLGVTAEELFSLPLPDARTEQVALLDGSQPARSGQPVRLCRVDKRLVASADSPIAWRLPSGDAIMTGRTSARICDPDADLSHRILIAGCDPGISVLARHMQSTGIGLIVAQRNSTQALALLKKGEVHIAGTHLRDAASGESNIAEIARLFRRTRWRYFRSRFGRKALLRRRVIQKAFAALKT